MIHRVSRSVLVVDDDPQFRMLAARLLARSGLTVIGEADTAAGALSAAGRLKPSAVLLDAELLDGDGIKLARELGALPCRPRIVLTYIDPDTDTAENVGRAGATGFVNKVDLASAPLAQLLGGD
jgi:DNA-binding NarL/FixJ family response regulator